MKTILVVDDEYDIASALETVFTIEGYAVQLAYNGQEALELLMKGSRPDVIISDIMMPNMDGYAFTRAVRAQSQFNSLPLILVSAARLDLTHVEKKDYQAFLSKPFDLNLLVATIEKVVAEKQRADGESS